MWGGSPTEKRVFSVAFSVEILSVGPLVGSSSALECIKTRTVGLCNLQDQEGGIGS